MKIIKPYTEILTPLDALRESILRQIELCGRVCYKSEGRITDGSYVPFVKAIVARGHESVLEHASATIRFVCDRGVSHEIVRHRLASYSQESTRYCNYGKDDFGCEITVIEPEFLMDDTTGYAIWKQAMADAELAYFSLLEWGCTPEEARAVLPNALKTELIMTANMREWRYFFRLRCAPAAHPQMRSLAVSLYRKFAAVLPELFGDIGVELRIIGIQPA